MEFYNSTKMVAGYTMGMLADGRERLVVAVKGTFNLPKNGEKATLCADQVSLVEADTFTNEPGLSAPIYESDFAPTKPYCDVILNGSAYAPGGSAARTIGVGLKVGRVVKAFNVIGDRVWESGISGVGASATRPFVNKAISYDVAFGGTDRFSEDQADHDAFMQNPSGIGFRRRLTGGNLNGTPMPNTEERKNPVKSPIGDYKPMAFGPVARGWESRTKFAGTYDKEWLDDVFPFLPGDFDERYFQCAPEDQQTEYLKGGEEVRLVNLTPDGDRVFELPKINVPIAFIRYDGETVTASMVADTLCIEPDKDRFSLVWRANIPLRQNLFEIAQVYAGKMSRAWWRARELGKDYFPSVAAAVQAGRNGASDDIS